MGLVEWETLSCCVVVIGEGDVKGFGVGIVENGDRIRLVRRVSERRNVYETRREDRRKKKGRRIKRNISVEEDR